VQATRDAREDQRDIARAERAHGGGEISGDAGLPQRGGEFLAVLDEPADEVEQAPGAAGLSGGGWGGGRGGHEPNKNTRWWPV
jgi:hypothetical protein